MEGARATTPPATQSAGAHLTPGERPGQDAGWMIPKTG